MVKGSTLMWNIIKFIRITEIFEIFLNGSLLIFVNSNLVIQSLDNEVL